MTLRSLFCIMTCELIKPMSQLENATVIRVRYGETDQMGTFYNSKALEWFECGRSEHMRTLGLPYTEVEAKGIYLPIVEAYVQYVGRAKYDDLLTIFTKTKMCGKVRIRFDMKIVHAESQIKVVEGYTIHTCTNKNGKPVKPPKWLTSVLESEDE